MRLPNSDICPIHYDPRNWRRLNAIQPRTFKVIDLKSFCNAIGRSANILGPVRDVRVSIQSTTFLKVVFKTFLGSDINQLHCKKDALEVMHNSVTVCKRRTI